MTECGFWFWFTKPFAELTAAVAVIIGFCLIYALWAMYMDWSYQRKKGKK